jgi:hypothetical protein
MIRKAQAAMGLNGNRSLILPNVAGNRGQNKARTGADQAQLM